MGEAGSPPAPSLLAEEWDEPGWLHEPSLPLGAPGAGKEELYAGRNPKKTQPLCWFLQTPCVLKESFAHFWASCIWVCSLPSQGEVHVTWRNLPFAISIKFPFFVKKVVRTSGHVLNFNFKFQLFEFIILLNIQFNILNELSIILNIKTFHIFYMI